MVTRKSHTTLSSAGRRLGCAAGDRKRAREQGIAGKRQGLAAAHEPARRLRLPRLRLARSASTPAPFEFCENGAKAVAWEHRQALHARVLRRPHRGGARRRGATTSSRDQAASPHPMRYDAATTTMCRSPGTKRSRDRRSCARCRIPDQAEFYTSGRSSNEAAFLYPAVRPRVPAPTIFPTARTCATRRPASACRECIGVGKGTVLLEDFDQTDAIFIIGHNPGTNSPRMMTSLREASRRGAPIVVFNPLRERALERFAAPQNPVEMVTLTLDTDRERFFQVRVGGDVAALKGMMKAMLDADDAARRRRCARGPRPRLHRRAHRRLRGARRRPAADAVGVRSSASPG